MTGSAADAGAAPIGQASYAVPSGAVFVSPDGSDTATGTQADPLRTLGKALSEAPSGGTIVLRAGSYHESVQDNTKPVTVQNYPGEAVWLDGSSVVTGWTQHGSTWIHTGWTAQFNSVPSYTGTVSTAPGWSFINSAHPMAANPDQMWLDGSPLVQVGSAADVGPGEFFADYADDELVIGNNPASHELRASDLGVALTSYAPNVTIRGIGIRRYATAVNQFGALRLLGKSDAVSNVISTENATTGVMLGAVDETVDHVTVTANGMLGLTGTYVDGLVVDGLLAEGNNTEGFNLSPVSGGMKIARTRGVTVENSQFVDNTGPGAWFDESVYNATVVGNVMADNVGHGMSYEISSTALIADNVVENNGGDGFKINDSDHVRIWNNTITGNGRDMEIVEDLRRGANLSDPGHNPHVAQPDPTEPWIIQNDSVMNNVFSPAANTYQLYVNDYSKQYTADQLDLDVDGNQFVRGTSTPMIVWGQGAANPKLFTTAAAFVSGTGQGSANVDVSAGQTQASGPEGVALPADIAQLLGQPAGTQHVGAF
ncbi:MAG: right-handed parallel beta-helix repeat-containing protein [Jatrophihabitans endophyticus]|nr:right-handed parallel beta-helix repeat-containing protein [Jatrophihabitans endophyticus]